MEMFEFIFLLVVIITITGAVIISWFLILSLKYLKYLDAMDDPDWGGKQ